MDVESTKQNREAMLRDAMAKVSPTELRAALNRATQSGTRPSRAVYNAMLALRRHHDPVPYLTRPQYRPTVPYVAAALSDECLTRTVEVLGDNSENPTREQLLAALDTLGSDFADPVIAVMLAWVAQDGLPSSDLCAELLASDPRYGLATGASQPPEPASAEDRAVSKEDGPGDSA
ncbi:MAG TPA: hypothetical protein VND67_07655 [Acidimicrobiales bacterium]|nr:hypothetical protein [Acidimicrobiales bacterium]